MKYVKVAVIILFILSVGIFAAGMEKERRAEDPTKPVLTSDREILEISTSYEEADLLQGLTAQDGKDGDLTSEILVGEFSQFVEKGVSNLSYVVFDSSNQAATLTRKVKFTDYESPRLTLTEPLVFPAGKTENAMEFIGASDMIDASLSALVKQTESTIDYKNVGDYYIHVEVTNSFGDVEGRHPDNPRKTGAARFIPTCGARFHAKKSEELFHSAWNFKVAGCRVCRRSSPPQPVAGFRSGLWRVASRPVC